jgi:GTP-binding protein
VLFKATLRDNTRFVIADLPGYGFAERSKGERDAWAPLIERYLKERASLAAVVILADARRGLEDEENQLVTYLNHIRRPYLIALTKIDKLSGAEKARTLLTLHKRTGAFTVGVSGETGEGRDDLMRRIRSFVRFEPTSSQPESEMKA